MRHRRWFRGDVALLVVGVAAIAGVVASVVPWGGSGNGQPRASTTAAALALAHQGNQYQELAALTSPETVFSSPGEGSFMRLSATRPITGEETILPVVKSSGASRGEWLEVMLPGRPNGRKGWIARAGTKLEYTRWRLVVNTSHRRVDVYDAGRRVRSFATVVGAPGTPTPVGEFFVEESVALKPSAVGYPYALALSARSNVIQEFAGGPGQIALHGLDNVGGTPGTAVSHGCLRLDTADISWLASHINPGVPVVVN
jgi:lipoprotein-anchoring transpeptidase ErfK/SrfK